MTEPVDIVTGAFGYTGRYIARRLLDHRRRVRTITGHPGRNDPLRTHLDVYPFDFEDRRAMLASFRGVDTFYNTYWIRFPHGRMTFDQAVANSRRLISTAAEAGVRRIVHISITNPAEDSPLPYFRGKALVERAVLESGLSHAIVRPTVVFGREDILINNIAYLLRRVPVFAVPGHGQYRLQPIFVDDLARIAVDAAATDDALSLDAAGPEIFTFEALVRLTARHVSPKTPILHAPPGFALAAARLAGCFLDDVLLTRDEVDGLMADLLVSAEPPRGTTSFSDWLAEHAGDLGTAYASELDRHYR